MCLQPQVDKSDLRGQACKVMLDLTPKGSKWDMKELGKNVNKKDNAKKCVYLKNCNQFEMASILAMKVVYGEI